MNKINIANYHTHTALCRHADGMPVDYVLQAQKDGCTELGFSDHAPFPLTMSDRWSDVRMSLDELPLYVKSVKEAALKASIKVITGFEAEWDKDYVSWYKEGLMGQYEAKYLVLGNHWVTKGKIHLYCKNITDKSDLHLYTDQTIQAIQSGLFKFIAHPDLFLGGWLKWDDEAKAAMKAILEAAVQYDMPLEINGYGLIKPTVMTERGERFQYPVDEFWETVAQTNAKVICNSDAHTPEVVVKNALKARDFAHRFGIKPIDRLSF